MRILVDCTPLSKGGGVQVAIAFLLNLLRSEEDWLAVVSTQIVPHLPTSLSGHARILIVQKSSAFDIPAISMFLSRKERAFRPEAVFTVFGPPYFVASAPHVCGFALPNMIYDPTPPLQRRGVVDVLLNGVRALILKRMDGLVVETETVKLRIERLLGTEHPAVHVIGNSINPLLLEFRSTMDFGAPIAARHVVLVPASYYRHKNLEILPEVCLALSEKLHGKEFLIALTLPRHSLQWLKISKHANALGVGECLDTLGDLPLERLAEAYTHCSCVLLPTLREVSTAVYPEAFFFRRPLITSDCDFAKELCGNAALYASSTDATAFADWIAAVLTDPLLYADLVNRGEGQLRAIYPTADCKFEQQMQVLRSARRG